MPTILCIDPDVRFLAWEKNVLEAKGYAVLIASNSTAGITLASTTPVDTVVLAFKMPGMDGCQVAELLFKQQPNLPIVICTGYFDAVPETLRWLADACVDKREAPDCLISTIQQAIARKKGQAVAA